MNCEDVKKYLSEYIDGELAPEILAVVSENLKVCPECGMEYSRLKKTVEYLHDLDELDAPPDIIVNVNKILDSETYIQKLWGFITGLVPHRIPYKTIAAVIAVIMVAYLSYKSPPSMKRLEKTVSELERHKAAEKEAALEEAVAPEEEEVSADIREAGDIVEEAPKPPLKKRAVTEDLKEQVKDVVGIGAGKKSKPVGETKVSASKARPKKKKVVKKKVKQPKPLETKELSD